MKYVATLSVFILSLNNCFWKENGGCSLSDSNFDAFFSPYKIITGYTKGLIHLRKKFSFSNPPQWIILSKELKTRWISDCSLSSLSLMEGEEGKRKQFHFQYGQVYSTRCGFHILSRFHINSRRRRLKNYFRLFVYNFYDPITLPAPLH